MDELSFKNLQNKIAARIVKSWADCCEEGGKMKIVREGRVNEEWRDNKRYKKSRYNISLIKGGKCAIFNAASGAVAVLNQDEMECSHVSETMKQMAENGFWVPEGVDEFQRHVSKIRISAKKKTKLFYNNSNYCM